MGKRATITCGIYKIVSPSGKIYIGQSVCIEERYSRYKNSKCTHQRKLYASIQKYGWNNHQFDVIVTCIKGELNFWEKFYIALYDSTGEYGLNIKTGGHEPKVTNESRQRMSDAHKGQVAWNKGRKATPEEVRKNSEAHRGEKHANWGKKLKPETIEKMRQRAYEREYKKREQKLQNI